MKHYRAYKMNVIGMSILDLCGYIITEKIRNEVIRKTIGVASIENKLSRNGNRLEWSIYVG